MSEQQEQSSVALVTGAVGSRDAIKTAREFFVEMVEQLADEGVLVNFHFEEVERAENGDWLSTFGFDRETSSSLARLGIPGNLTERAYRQVRIDAYTGEPRAITMRTL